MLKVPDIGEWVLNEGSVVIFPRELPHTMLAISPLEGEQRHLEIGAAQNIEGTSILCGSVEMTHRGGEHLLNMLPPVMVLDGDKAKRWLVPLNQLIVIESLQNPDLNSSILKRLSELLFAYALRCHAENSTHESGVLALYGHPRLSPAIRALHANPKKSWSLGNLASECALSRTRFANLFKSVSGFTVMQYVKWWRMQIAWSKLSQGATVEQTSDDVGYRSLAAFSRAFKDEFGVTVGAVRKLQN